MGATKTEATCAMVWAIGEDIDSVTSGLLRKIRKLTEEEGYCLQGGASIAVDNGTFYAMQTLIKEI